MGPKAGRDVLEKRKPLVPAGIRIPDLPAHLLLKGFLKFVITFQFYLKPVKKTWKCKETYISAIIFRVKSHEAREIFIEAKNI